MLVKPIGDEGLLGAARIIGWFQRADVLTRERLWRYPIALLVVTVAVYLFSVARSRELIEPNGEIVGRDFLAFYTAGDLVSRGWEDRLYDLPAQSTYQTEFMREINPRWSSTCLYLNPPHYAWVMSGIARFGYGPSLAIWWLLSLACFAATAVIWWRWFEPGARLLAIVLAVCMPAWFQAFAGGQNTFISLLILTSFCALLMKGHDTWAGVVLSLLAYKFQLLLVPTGWLLLSRRWRALVGFALGGLVTLLATLAMVGPDVLLRYVTFASQFGDLAGQEGFGFFRQHSWYGFFHLIGAGWLSPAQIQILTLTATAVTLLLLARISRGVDSKAQARFALVLSALMVATVVTSPHMFHYDMLLVCLPAVLWLRARANPDVAQATSIIKPLLAVGFIWLAIAGAVASATHVQLSPLLLLAWLSVYLRSGSFGRFQSSSG